MPAKKLSEMMKTTRFPVYATETAQDDPYILVRPAYSDFWQAYNTGLDAEVKTQSGGDRASKTKVLGALAPIFASLSPGTIKEIRAAIEEALGPWLSNADNDRIFVEVSIGKTFCGFGNILGEDGEPLKDRDEHGFLDAEACRKVLSNKDVWDRFTSARNQLDAEKEKRWEKTRPN